MHTRSTSVVSRGGTVSPVRTAAAAAGLVALAHAANDAYAAFLHPLLPRIMGKLDLSITLAASLAMTLSLAASLLQPVMGHLADRHGRRLFVILGPLLSGVALSMIGTAPSFAVLVLLLIVGGLGSAAFHPPGASMAARVSEGSGSGKRLSFFSFAGSVGYSAGPLLAVGLVSLLGLERLWFAMIPAIVLALVLARLLPSERLPSGDRAAPPHAGSPPPVRPSAVASAEAEGASTAPTGPRAPSSLPTTRADRTHPRGPITPDHSGAPPGPRSGAPGQSGLPPTARAHSEVPPAAPSLESSHRGAPAASPPLTPIRSGAPPGPPVATLAARVLARLRGPLGVLFGISAVGAFVQRVFLTMEPIIIARSGGSEAAGALALSIFLAGQAVGSLTGGVLADRFDRQRVLLALTLLAFPSFTLAFWLPAGSPAALGFAALAGLLNMATLPPLVVIAQETLPTRAALGSGIVMGLAWATGSIGMLATGALGDLLGARDAALASVPMILVGTLLALRPALRDYRRPAVGRTGPAGVPLG